MKKKKKETNHSIEIISSEIPPFLQIISSEMLTASRKHQPIITVIAKQRSPPLPELVLRCFAVVPPLEGSDVGHRVGRRHRRILPRRLRPSPPPGIPEDVDVGRPEREAGLPLVVHCLRLHRDGGGDRRPEGAVEGGGGEDDLGEAGGGLDGAVEGDAGAIGGEAVEGLRPPLVMRDAEAGDGGGVVGELLDLLREGEEGDEGPGPGFEREGGVAEGVGVVVRRLAWEFGGGVGEASQLEEVEKEEEEY